MVAGVEVENMLGVDAAPKGLVAVVEKRELVVGAPKEGVVVVGAAGVENKENDVAAVVGAVNAGVVVPNMEGEEDVAAATGVAAPNEKLVVAGVEGVPNAEAPKGVVVVAAPNGVGDVGAAPNAVVVVDGCDGWPKGLVVVAVVAPKGDAPPKGLAAGVDGVVVLKRPKPVEAVAAGAAPKVLVVPPKVEPLAGVCDARMGAARAAFFFPAW